MHMYWKKEKRMNTTTMLKFWPITDGSPGLHRPIRPKFVSWRARCVVPMRLRPAEDSVNRGEPRRGTEAGRRVRAVAAHRSVDG